MSLKTNKTSSLVTETVKNPSLPLQSVNYVQGSNSLTLGVFSVSDGITNSVLEEDLIEREEENKGGRKGKK